MSKNNTLTSCTVILNGHGRYSTGSVINLTNINYDITFPCSMKKTISNAHHNLLLKSFTSDINNSWNILEGIKTTYKANHVYLQNHTVDMFSKQTSLIFDHGLSNADNVLDVQSLIDIDNQRFISHTISNNRQWNNNTLEIQFDQTQVVNDVIASHQVQLYQYNTNINLSSNNLIYIKPVAQQGSTIEFKLSDLLTDIIPKIKIPFVYHQNQSANILNYVFIDDNQCLNTNISIHDKWFTQNNLHNQNCQISQQCNDITHSIICNNNEEVMRILFATSFTNNTDQYHELTIAGDANIIWDACRDEFI